MINTMRFSLVLFIVSSAVGSGGRRHARRLAALWRHAALLALQRARSNQHGQREESRARLDLPDRGLCREPAIHAARRRGGDVSDHAAGPRVCARCRHRKADLAIQLHRIAHRHSGKRRDLRAESRTGRERWQGACSARSTTNVVALDSRTGREAWKVARRRPQAVRLQYRRGAVDRERQGDRRRQRTAMARIAVT